MNKSKCKILKVKPPNDYPPEEGCCLRGNDFSPVAVVVMLNSPREHTPPEIEQLVRVAIEKGAALAGTLQTENIGIEKIVTNIVSNPNIRYLILCGAEVAGHNSGDALKCLLENGVNEKRTIVGSKALTPYLFNVPIKSIERFQKQLTFVNRAKEVLVENQLRGLNIVLGALQAAAGDICKNCICLEGAKTKVGKMVKKLGVDLETTRISCEKTKAGLKDRIGSLSKTAEELEVAEEYECQKTIGNCKIEEGCFVNAAIDLMKLIK